MVHDLMRNTPVLGHQQYGQSRPPEYSMHEGSQLSVDDLPIHLAAGATFLRYVAPDSMMVKLVVEPQGRAS